MSARQSHRPPAGGPALVCAVACLQWLAAFCAAQPPAVDPAHPPLSKSDGGQKSSMLVTTSGRVVEGEVRQSAGGYVVETPTGRMLVPFEHVRFEAIDWHDAYLKMRHTLPAKTATSHLSLARWCITNDLYDEAAAELRDALHLEPRRDEARTMLVRLEELRRPVEPSDERLTAPAAHTADGFELPEVQSLAGLSRDAAHEFAVRVQPMLLNKCGNATCHGPAAANGFRLTHTRITRGNRVFAERNLAEVLRQIDLPRPDQSPLLTVPRGNHGRAGRSIFYGPSGDEQLELLRRWVRQAAKDRAPPVHAGGSRKNGSISAFEQHPPQPSLARTAETVDPAEDDVRPAVFPQPVAPARPTPASGADVLDRVLHEQRTDAFDPQEFNRAVHGHE